MKTADSIWKEFLTTFHFETSDNVEALALEIKLREYSLSFSHSIQCPYKHVLISTAVEEGELDYLEYLYNTHVLNLDI